MGTVIVMRTTLMPPFESQSHPCFFCKGRGFYGVGHSSGNVWKACDGIFGCRSGRAWRIQYGSEVPRDEYEWPELKLAEVRSI